MVGSRPFRMCSLARHIYHRLRPKESYDGTDTFRDSRLQPASMQALLHIRANLDARFEAVNACLSQSGGQPSAK